MAQRKGTDSLELGERVTALLTFAGVVVSVCAFEALCVRVAQ